MNDIYTGLAWKPKYNYGGGYSGTMEGYVDDYKQNYGVPNYTNIPLTSEQPIRSTTQSSMFSGLASPTWQGIGSTLQGIGGLASAYMGYKQYGLAKDAFKFNKGLANRNLATQGQLLNQEMYDRKARELAGSGLSEEEKTKRLEEVKNKYIDTTPIK